MIHASRNHAGYWAFLAHRISGLGLALFLPVHFLVLGLALREQDTLDGFLRWTDHPGVKLVETLLIALLAVHLAGGVRLLALEFLPWSDRQKSFISAAFGTAVLAGMLFALSAG